MLIKTHEMLKCLEPNPVEFVVEPGLLSATGLMAIAGEPGVGKTWMAMQAAYDIANGRRLFGLFPTRKSRSAYFELENRTVNEENRFKQFPGDKDNLGYCSGIEPTFDNAQFQTFHNAIEEWKAEVVVIDSYQATIDDENDLRAQKNTLKRYRQMANNLKIAIILVQSINKRSRSFNKKGNPVIMPISLDDIRGSKIFEYNIDTAVGLSKDSHHEKYIQLLKTRHCKYPLTDIRIDLAFDPGNSDGFVYQPRNPTVFDLINTLDREGVCEYGFLESCLKITRPTLISIVSTLKSMGLVEEKILDYPNKAVEPINLSTNHRNPTLKIPSKQHKLRLSDFNPE